MQNTSYSVGFVDSTTVQLRLELGQIDFARVTTDMPTLHHVNQQDGYAFDANGNLIGRVRGKDDQFFVPLDTYNPSVIEEIFEWTEVNGVRAAPADTLASWSVAVNGQSAVVTGISRKANILETANTGWQLDYTTLQNVFLELDQPLSPDDAITIDFDGPGFEEITAAYDPANTISEAVHVNLVGHDPDDSVKAAYLSSWNGFTYDPAHERGGEDVPQTFGSGLTYTVIYETTGQAVLSGQTELAQGSGQGTNSWQNYALTDVWQIDLSALDTSGSYHVVVDGVGRSQSFTLNDNHWDDIFDLVFKGYYHQRSGIALEDSYTDWTRPRALHPDDGIVIRQTTVKITDTSEAYDGSLPKPFEFWEGNLTGETLTDAWGGWHDAGDFDRRTQHMQTTRKLIELHDMQTDWSEGYDGNIPESGDNIPDLLNEALWGTEVFRRLQHDDGGVPGGIESASYGGYGDSSFTDQRDLYVYAPDVWSSWEYAATAAKIARALAPYDAPEAAAWLASGVAAFDWAEARVPTADVYDNGFLPAARNLAAAELFETTGEARYANLFAQTFAYAIDDNVEWFENQYDAAWVHATTQQAGADAALKALALSTIEDRAEWLLENGTNSGFGFVHDPYAPYGWGATASQPTYSADFLVRMHALTGDQKYLDAITQDVNYALGANPMNMSFITGLDRIVPGVRQPEEVLHADMDVLGIDPPPGITLYGEHNVYDYGWGGWHSEMWEETWPNYYDAPVHESWNGAYGFVPVTEFTVMQGMEDMAFVTGYLAALSSTSAPNTAPVLATLSNITLVENRVATGLFPSASDVDGDSLTISLLGPDASAFEIIDGEIVFRAIPDFDAPDDADRNNVYALTVQASDGALSDSETVQITVTSTPSTDPGDLLDINGTRVAVASYGGNQDEGQAVVSADSSAILLSDNAWKRAQADLTVTADTILRFDFKSDAEGEIHGIGFDTDDSLSSEWMFQLDGTQTWGVQAYDDLYTTGSGWQRYEILVGDHFTGDFDRLVFAMDDDRAVGGDSGFANIEVSSEQLNDGALSINGDRSAVASYGGKQDEGQAVVSTDSSTILLSDNAWKRAQVDLTVTADTILRFDFKSDTEGEIHGIGFDTDDSLSSEWMFQLDGTQTWGVQTYDELYTTDSGWQRYEIRVGDHFTGDFDRLVFAMDDDRAVGGDSGFANIEII